MRKAVFNLEFPSWTKEISIHGYRFYRVNNYEERLKALQHLTNCHSELSVSRNEGGHSHTAYVDLPNSEPTAVISPGTGSTALDDITLLLSLFTGRDVLSLDEPTGDKYVDGVIVADPNISRRIGVLICSIPYRRDDSGEDTPGNAGFAEGINAIYSRIRSQQWQRQYGPSHFLLLAKHALLPNHPWSIAYTQCWTIWEHLYGLLNQTGHRRTGREQAGRRGQTGPEAVEKIQFLLNRYGLKGGSPKDRVRIRSLASIRNSLVHEGRFPEYASVHKDVMLFINLTQFILARALGLMPSNVMNTVERLESFLSEHGGK